MIPPSQARGTTGTLGLNLTSERDNKGELGGTEPMPRNTTSKVRLVANPRNLLSNCHGLIKGGTMAARNQYHQRPQGLDMPRQGYAMHPNKTNMPQVRSALLQQSEDHQESEVVPTEETSASAPQYTPLATSLLLSKAAKISRSS